MVERAYRVSELAAMSGIPRTTLYLAIRRGDVRSFRMPGMERGIRVWASDWERFCEGRGMRVAEQG